MATKWYTKHRRGALGFCKVICKISWQHGTKYQQFCPKLNVYILEILFESTDDYKVINKAWCGHRRGDLLFLAVTEQLYEWFSLSVCLPITPFWLCSHHRITQKFSGVITKDRSDVHAKTQGQKSKVKVTEVKTQLRRFQTVTPVWIHIWSWNECCIKLDVAKERCPILFQGHPPNFKVTRLKKIVDFYLNGAFPDCNSSLNTPMAIKWCTKL